MSNKFKILWDKITPSERLEIVSDQINTWLPIQYHDFDFIYDDFDDIPEPVRNWLIKYNLKDE